MDKYFVTRPWCTGLPSAETRPDQSGCHWILRWGQPLEYLWLSAHLHQQAPSAGSGHDETTKEAWTSELPRSSGARIFSMRTLWTIQLGPKQVWTLVPGYHTRQMRRSTLKQVGHCPRKLAFSHYCFWQAPNRSLGLTWPIQSHLQLVLSFVCKPWWKHSCLQTCCCVTQGTQLQVRFPPHHKGHLLNEHKRPWHRAADHHSGR